MTSQTNPASRREMVQAISERLNSPAVYLRMPACAYRIGELTVERDGSIVSDDEALLETLRPMLIERGWLTDAADYEVPAGQESGEEAVMSAGLEAPAAENVSAAKESEITEMELSFPVEDWTVPQLSNLLRTLYSNQYILRRMMLSDALYIDRQLVERLSEVPMETLADFEALLADALATGLLNGCRVQDGNAICEHQAKRLVLFLSARLPVSRLRCRHAPCPPCRANAARPDSKARHAPAWGEFRATRKTARRRQF